MRFRRLCLACGVLALATPAFAIELSRFTGPQAWVCQVLPDDQPLPHLPAYATDIDRARVLVNAGRYPLALAKLASLGSSPDVAVPRAKALAAMGQIDAALAAASSDDPQVVAARAELLIGAGRPNDAMASLRLAIGGHPADLSLHFWLGRALEAAGDGKGAADAYGWFIAPPQNYLERWRGQGVALFDNAAHAVAVGQAIDRWAILTGAYRHDPSLHDTLFDLFVKSYDQIDRAYAPAHVAAAEFLMSHDDSEAAMGELKQAIDANPHDAAALPLVGRIAIDAFNYSQAEAIAWSLREVDPTSPAADRLEARAIIAQNLPAQAKSILRRLLARQPADLEAIGLLAAGEALQLHDDASAAALHRADAAAPASPVAYETAGELLAVNHQYDRAGPLFQIAIDRAPDWVPPRTNLGQLLTQTGDDGGARAALEAAYAVDPFNVKTVNYLRVLDQMKDFQRADTDHFTFYFAARDAAIVPTYFGPYMEQAYADVSRDFSFEPRQKTIIEVFPTVDAFSVRLAGVPGAETFGASLGPVIAAVAPKAGQTLGTYNWARVLRHEFTHTMNLAQTQNRVPRWFTEGLAVWEEHVPFRFAWVPEELYKRATTNHLFTIRQLPLALLHPRNSRDGEMAYMEGFWVVRYVRDTFGPDAAVRLLNAYKSGKNDAEAFPAALGVSTAEFEPKFFAWARQQAASWGYDADSTTKSEALRKEGEAAIAARQYADALAAFEQLTTLRPMDVLPHERLAGLYLTKAINQPAKAIKHLRAVQDIELKDDRYAKRIARIEEQLDNLPKAADAAMEAIEVNPYDVAAHQLLLEIAHQQNDAAAASREQTAINALNTEATPGDGALSP